MDQRRTFLSASSSQHTALARASSESLRPRLSVSTRRSQATEDGSLVIRADLGFGIPIGSEHCVLREAGR